MPFRSIHFLIQINMNARRPSKASLMVLVASVLFSAISLCPHAFAQTDANGNAITDDQIVNNPDRSARNSTTTETDTTHTRGGDGSRETTRDSNGRVTNMKVKDSRGRVRREINIRYDQEGGAEFESTEYRSDGKPDTTTRTTWPASTDGRRTPTRRERIIYHPTRVGADGKPVVAEHYYEWLQDGRWVRGSSIGPPSKGTPGTPGISQLSTQGKIAIEISGTGETVGHVADLKLTNKTKEKIIAVIPPMILVCGNGKSQDYAVPFEQTVTVAPGKSVIAPMNGVCIARNKPPVAAGVSGELIAQDTEGNQLNTLANADKSKATQFTPHSSAEILREVASCFKAAQILQEEGAYANMPYSDPKIQKEIAVQWSVWSNPQVARATGQKLATKADLAKTIYKQAEQGGPLTADKKKLLESGINSIFQSIELTGKKAKELQNQ
jgi:hypothetical protein